MLVEWWTEQTCTRILLQEHSDLGLHRLFSVWSRLQCSQSDLGPNCFSQFDLGLPCSHWSDLRLHCLHLVWFESTLFALGLSRVYTFCSWSDLNLHCLSWSDLGLHCYIQLTLEKSIISRTWFNGGLVHCYHLDESISSCRSFWWRFTFLLYFAQEFQ